MNRSAPAPAKFAGVLCPQDSEHFFQVLPCRRFLGRASQQISRMVCAYQRNPPPEMDLAAKLEHRACVPQKTLGRAQSESANDLGAKGLDLPEQERRASGRFVGLRGTVLRRTALDDIADIDFLALETDCEDHF